MKTFAYVLSFIFVSFLFTPSLVALIDRDIDISLAYDVNEEESSSKNQISFEYNLEELHSNCESIHFLKEHNEDVHYYHENCYLVFLDILSPPPKA
ncbi:hypothetical protein [Christiangramia aquimixticola]|uniref:hypothetical protein n=1 Tax=Christiangramia aquimixticola TaxID=1697558 RepID=UPI003AA893AC